MITVAEPRRELLLHKSLEIGRMPDRVFFTESKRHAHFFSHIAEGVNSEDYLLRRAIIQQICNVASRNIEHSSTGRRAHHFMEAGNKAVFDALAAFWRIELKIYEQSVFPDWKKFIGDFSIMMTDGRTNLFVDGTMATHFNLSDCGFDAHIGPKSALKLDNQQIYLSGGVMMALDDLSFRAFCNSSFYSWEAATNAEKWGGCQCFFSHLQPSHVRPTLRYGDYTPHFDAVVEAGVRGQPVFPDLVTTLYSGLPIGDPERIRAADLASQIALSWVLAHEVGHYRHGHFHLLRDRPTLFGLQKRHFRQRRDLWMADGGGRPSAIHNAHVSRFMEWNADRAATESVIDIFFHPDQSAKMPAYCEGDWTWLLGLILTAMCMSAMIFDRMALAKGRSDHHPTGLARVIGIIAAGTRRVSDLARATAIHDPEISRYLGEITETERIETIDEVIFNVLADILIFAEIIENENKEGVQKPSYVFPIDNDMESLQYLYLTTLGAIYVSPLKEYFLSQRDISFSRRPLGRWVEDVFDEVKGYLADELGLPASEEIKSYTKSIREYHERKLRDTHPEIYFR